MPRLFINSYLIIRVIFSEGYESVISSLCNFFHPHIASSPLRPDILLSILFSNAQSLYPFLNVGDHVSRPYNTISNVCMLVLSFLRCNMAEIWE